MTEIILINITGKIKKSGCSVKSYNPWTELRTPKTGSKQIRTLTKSAHLDLKISVETKRIKLLLHTGFKKPLSSSLKKHK